MKAHDNFVNIVLVYKFLENITRKQNQATDKYVIDINS